MESIISRIKSGKFWKFHGGIHPPEQKHLTNKKPIRNIPLPKQLTLPLQQHIGSTGSLLVSVGDKVLKGQALTSAKHPMSVPIHAPTSGVITDIRQETIPHPSGMQAPCIILTPDGEETWVTREPIDDIYQLTREQIVSKISSAGIAGMGGAGFPTGLKLNVKPVINFLIINAAECEPYITCDDLLMHEQSAAIAKGIDILDHLLLPEHILIGIEDNKPDAIAALQNSTQHNEKVQVCVLPTKYPTGGEKQLIQILTGKEITHGRLPIDHGIIMQNVATVFAISEAVCNDIPLIRRVVTVSGQGVEKPQNVWSLLGTPVSHLLDHCHYPTPDEHRVIMGGPMMGFTLPDIDIPIVKTSNCILAPSEKEIPKPNKELECIRCGECADVCPSSLLPQELQWHAKAKNYDMLDKLNLFDCIDCGACAYVCPSYIPLVQYYRVAKAEIREINRQQAKAEKAKLRFEARKQRLEKEKLAREEKHKLAAAARRAKMNSADDTGSAPKDAVAAALARVKAKKAAANVSSINTDVDNNKEAENTSTADETKTDKMAAAKARAIAKAKAKKADEAKTEETKNTDVETPKDDKLAAAKARAIAKAKAKKAGEAKTDETKDTDVETSKDDKLAAAKARAIAKAKAKKAGEAKTEESKDTDVETSKDDKLAAAKARAIAKAKAKKAGEAKTDETKDTDVETSKDDKVAAAKARAIAKAKAKKAEKDAENNSEALEREKLARKEKIKARAAELVNSSVNEELIEDVKNTPQRDAEDKKEKIAKAIAKAKAKKLAKSDN